MISGFPNSQKNINGQKIPGADTNAPYPPARARSLRQDDISLADAHDDLNDPLLAVAAQLRASPAFPDAVREYTIAIARFREAPRLINKLIASETRFRLTAYVFCFATYYERHGPQGGVTYTQLLNLCASREELTPHTLRTTLTLLKLGGFVKTSRHPFDRRSKSYHPTPRMMDFVRSWMPHAVNALDAVQPDMQRARMLAQDPDFIPRFAAAAEPGANRQAFRTIEDAGVEHDRRRQPPWLFRNRRDGYSTRNDPPARQLRTFHFDRACILRPTYAASLTHQDASDGVCAPKPICAIIALAISCSPMMTEFAP